MKARLLCIDDDQDFLVGIRLKLHEMFKVLTADSLEKGIDLLAAEPIDMVLLDVNLGSENGVEGIRRIKSANPDVDIVMLSGRHDPKTVVEAIRIGAVDYLTKPFNVDELMAIVERQTKNHAMRDRYSALIQTQNARNIQESMIYKSMAMHRLLNQAAQLKGHQANVLIVGETGTGKELLARHIHRLEANEERPFIAVNCAAIPEQLLEAELFGSEAGAYTGAIKRRIGKFELADGGDIFLDEISALKIDLQAKILRVLQEREFCRLGGNEMIHANFRVIAATNETLEEKVSQGAFRMDLYHRVRVIEFRIPPLRERREDIPILVEYTLRKFAKGDRIKQVSPGALSKLMEYHWPGNVRELMNVVHSLTILAPGNVIDEGVFPSWAMNGCGGDHGSPSKSLPLIDDTVSALKDYVSKAERNYIEHALDVCHGDKSKAARMLQMGRTTLYSKLKDLGMM